MVGLALTALAGLFPASAAFGAAADTEVPTANDSIAAAVRWLGHQQRDGGGFDAFVPGAATPDAILALAESAQTSSTWGNRPALERVEQQESDDGKTPVDAARVLARGDEAPEVAARLLTRVALPLGLDPSDEGPFGAAIDRVTAGLADEDTAFADRVDLAIALLDVAVPLPDGTIDQVLAAQQSTGGWAADGDPASEATDLATTGAVVDLLVLSGVPADDSPVANAMAFVGSTQSRDGTWNGDDGEPSTLATAGAIRAIRVAGQDPSGSCWQTDLGIPTTDTSAEAALIGLQAHDGRFPGEDPVVATSTAVHALSGRWLPRGRLADACGPDGGPLLPFEPSLIVLGAIAVVGVGGGVRILRGAPAAY